MENKEYIKLDRSFLKWRWYQDKATTMVFLHLLFTARSKPYFSEGLELKEGQVAKTVDEISLETGIKRCSVRTALKNLKSTNEITVETTPQFNIITLNNYTDYLGDYE